MQEWNSIIDKTKNKSTHSRHDCSMCGYLLTKAFSLNDVLIYLGKKGQTMHKYHEDM